jgi:hypothetical protein
MDGRRYFVAGSLIIPDTNELVVYDSLAEIERELGL